jgi:hypothetical protein
MQSHVNVDDQIIGFFWKCDFWVKGVVFDQIVREIQSHN